MRKPACPILLLSLGAAGLLAGARPASACNIPVFRYALERWAPDPYEVFVFNRGPLSPADQALLDRLADADSDRQRPANIQLQFVDLDAQPDAAAREVWNAQSAGRLPWIVVRYPRPFANRTDLWSGPMTDQAVDAILDSPVRKELARRLASGQTGVWVFVESGNKADDDAAADRLTKTLTRLEKELAGQQSFPPAAPPGSGAGFPEADLSQVDVSFSVLRTARAEAKEQLLLAMLGNSEPDLKALTGPMAFPVFGRGRALYALVGAGINADTIQEACGFLVGPCSCQVKDENPGVDLLLAMNWESAVTPLYDDDGSEVAPPLAAGSPTPQVPAPRDSADASEQADGLPAEIGTDLTQSKAASPIMRNLLILVGLAVLALAGTTVALKLRKQERQVSSGI